MARGPLVDEPCVVGAREGGGVVGLRQHRQLEQVVGEEHREVDVDLAQLGDHLLGRVDHPRGLVGGREARGQRAVAAGREAGDVEVALGHVGDVAQRDVPRPVAVRRQRARALVDVHVGVDDEQVGQWVRRPRSPRSIACVRDRRGHGGRAGHPPHRRRSGRALCVPVPAGRRRAHAAGRHRAARHARGGHRPLPGDARPLAHRPRRRPHLARRRRSLRRQPRAARRRARRAPAVRRGRPRVDRVQRS